MMRKQKIKTFFHYAFVPWLVVWNQSASKLTDQTRLQIALAKTGSQCKSIMKTYDVKIAHSAVARSRGLGGRSTKLTSKEGMLFIFDKPDVVNFWMKVTY